MNDLRDKLLKFRSDRGWDHFHTPENLAKSICIEAAELLKCFQWGGDWPDNQNYADELADILIYCIYFAHAMGIDIYDAIASKIKLNEKKYPVGDK